MVIMGFLLILGQGESLGFRYMGRDGWPVYWTGFIKRRKYNGSRG